MSCQRLNSHTLDTIKNIQTQPSTTPFTYTTLFRSIQEATSSSGRRRAASSKAVAMVVIAGRPDPHGHRLRGGGADRKSTRLNSSHSQISYAVFCLKKKKTKN